jgi:hypothetical protein
MLILISVTRRPGIDPLGPKEEKGHSLTYRCLRIEFIVNLKTFMIMNDIFNI